MPSWQSSFFGRLTRMSRPRTAAAETDNDELRRQFAYLSDRFGAIPPGVSFEPGQVGPIKGEWVRVDAASPKPADPLFPRRRLYLRLAGEPPPADRAAVPGRGRNRLLGQLSPRAGVRVPAGLRDGIDAYRHLIQKKIPASSIVLAGDGAGGGLAFGCLLAIRTQGSRCRRLAWR